MENIPLFLAILIILAAAATIFSPSPASVFFLGVAVFLIAIFFRSDKRRQKQWGSFARSKGLKHQKSSLLIPSRVTGIYRGYKVELALHFTISTIYSRKVHTVMQVTAPSVGNPGKNNRQEILVRPKVGSIAKLLAPHGLPNLSKQPEATVGGSVIFYKEDGPMAEVRVLRRTLELLCDITDGYPLVVKRGGKAISELQEIAGNRAHLLQKIAVQLLRDIAADTTVRLKSRISHLFCPHCLTRFGPRQIEIAWIDEVTYYGCRRCGQSREFEEGEIVAVLDLTMPAEQLWQGQTLRVNWLARRAFFDFDAIEIIHASDEDVERFAVQAGNDTDPMRRRKYPKIHCFISSETHLALNTLRILQKIFGRIEKTDNLPAKEAYYVP